MTTPQTRPLVLNLPWNTVAGGFRLASKHGVTMDQFVAALIDGALAVHGADLQQRVDVS